MSETVNSKLYKIQDFLIKEKNNNEELIQSIIDNYIDKSGNEFIEIMLSEKIKIDGWKAKLYVYTTDNKLPHWYDFLKSIVNNEDDLEDIQIQYSSFVLFVYDKESIFVISKGYYGHFLLDDYIEPFFGMDVLSRLVNKSSTEIKQIEERGLFGIELGAQRFFRENYNLAFDDDFGKIYKAMLASINEDDFSKLGIIKKRTSTQKLSINGSSSLEISSKFNYDELIKRLIKIKELLDLEGVEFNQFYRLPYSSISPIIKELSSALISYSYQCLKESKNIDFFSPDIFEYLRSIETQFYNEDGLVKDIEFCSSVSYIEIMNLLIKAELIDDTSLETYTHSLKNTYGRFRNIEAGEFSRRTSLDSWICGEVEFKAQKYFKLDGSWYIYRTSLDEYLNRYFANINFSDLKPTYLLEPWKGGNNEDEYNEDYKKIESFILGDKVYLNNIEMFDIMRIINDEIYLYHVKKGLGQDTRVLINQINNAARFLTFSQDEEYKEGLRIYYKNISKKHYNENEISIIKEGALKVISEEDFVQLFDKKKKIYFVFAYASENNKTVTEEIINTRSRIAKLSLVYILRDIKRMDFPLLIEKIPLI